MQLFSWWKVGVVAVGLLQWAEASEGAAPSELPFPTRFQGEGKFQALVEQAKKEGWESLPLGERTAAVGRALLGTPYQSYTLEIDDKIEAVSANLEGMDCWTFFEISLGFARMLQENKEELTPQRLLDQIERDRYRKGKCTGEYLSRIHYLAEWYVENEQRGLIQDLTQELGGVPMGPKVCKEMSTLWRHYRYLKKSPQLRKPLAQMEAKVSQLPVYHIPKEKVKEVEPHLQSGDVIGITTKGKGAYCSHVGLAYRDDQGVLRLMHATSTHRKGRKVIIDKRLSDYLAEHRAHAGILVARPLEVAPVKKGWIPHPAISYP